MRSSKDLLSSIALDWGWHYTNPREVKLADTKALSNQEKSMKQTTRLLSSCSARGLVFVRLLYYQKPRSRQYKG